VLTLTKRKFFRGRIFTITTDLTTSAKKFNYPSLRHVLFGATTLTKQFRKPLLLNTEITKRLITTNTYSILSKYDQYQKGFFNRSTFTIRLTRKTIFSSSNVYSFSSRVNNKGRNDGGTLKEIGRVSVELYPLLNNIQSRKQHARVGILSKKLAHQNLTG